MSRKLDQRKVAYLSPTLKSSYVVVDTDAFIIDFSKSFKNYKFLTHEILLITIISAYD